MDIFSLKGKQALVTGGGSGIGKEMSVLFARRGAKVVVLDMDLSAAESVASSINKEMGSTRAVGMRCDVTQAQDVQRVFDQAAADGGIHIVCNNAGISHVGNIETAEEADLDRVVKVNINGVFNCSKAAIKHMIAAGKGGVILNTGSCASIHPIKDRIIYATTKGAITTMTTSLATDHVHHGIRVNCICPGRVRTPFVEGFVKKNYPGREAEMLKQLGSYMPQGRMLEPEEIAAAALYLVSDEAKMVTGAAFAIDGGVVGADHPKVYDGQVVMHPSLAAKL
jgi:NAD(P)-dependent dehydrogenase (short-subunit alcohol dehydrogenase family)